MERKITGNLNNKVKKELLRFFNAANNKNYKEIRNVKKFYGLPTPLETYEHLRELYNREVEVRRGESKTAEKDFYKQNVSEIKVRGKSYEEILSLTYEIIKRFKGSSIILQYIVDRRFIRNRTADVPTTGFSKFWNVFTTTTFMANSAESIFLQNDFKGKILIFEQRNDIKAEKVKQYFRDGVNHCVFHPIKKWAENIMKESNSKRTMERYRAIVNHCDKFIEKYEKGVPEEEFPEICNKLQLHIEIQLPFLERKFLRYESEKKPLRTFKFLNTRINHLEENNIVSKNNYKEVTLEQLYQIKDDLDARGEFYTFKRNNHHIREISTLFEIYKTESSFHKTVSEFEINSGLIYCKIDDINDSVLSAFVDDGVHYNETIDFKDINGCVVYEPTNTCKYWDEDVNHIDMKKAYTQFKHCKWYNGFLGKITDYRKTNKVVGDGLYRITDLDFRMNARLTKLNNQMKIFMNNNVYTSAELRFLDEMKIKYKIVEGCWGIEPLHFEFNDEMINSKCEDGVTYFAKWTGMCNQHNTKQKFWLNGDDDYVKVLKAEEYATISKFDTDTNEVCIEFPKEHNFHLSHITAFITAYQRLSMLEQLLVIPYNNIIRVCVDGIYFLGDVELKNVFRFKDEYKFGNIPGKSYISNIVDTLTECDIEFRENHKKELHSGEGGCGKTHYNLNDSGLIRKLYVAPSWKLARNKQKENGVKATVWARLVTQDPELISKWKKYYNVLIIDEISMMTNEMKMKIFELYSDMKIIMCGDIGYQLPPIIEAMLINKVHNFEETGFDYIKRYSTDYRCKCIKLKEIKNKVRHFINKKVSIKKILKYIEEKFTKINADELKQLYKIDDMIICRTNITKDKYTNLFTGKFDVEKYYVTENCKSYCNGEIVIGDKPSGCKSEVRHCFTVHSIQGETAEHNLFIDIARVSCAKMIYTAISRARRFEQIFILKSE